MHLQNIFFMVNASMLEIRRSKFGQGLFAKKDIAAATSLCSVTGDVLRFQQTVLLGERESHCLQVEHDKYILCETPFLYTNHSCEPNCALTSQLQLVTLRHVKCNEELFWDYSTSMLERHWTMACNCGSTACRNLITDFDLLPETTQTIYLQKGIVLPFIAEHIQNFSKVHINCA